MKDKKRELPKQGDYVQVKAFPGNISMNKRTGYVISVMYPLVKVEIIYGRQKGYWAGNFKDVKILVKKVENG